MKSATEFLKGLEQPEGRWITLNGKHIFIRPEQEEEYKAKSKQSGGVDYHNDFVKPEKEKAEKAEYDKKIQALDKEDWKKLLSDTVKAEKVTLVKPDSPLYPVQTVDMPLVVDGKVILPLTANGDVYKPDGNHEITQFAVQTKNGVKVFGAKWSGAKSYDKTVHTGYKQAVDTIKHPDNKEDLVDRQYRQIAENEARSKQLNDDRK